MVLDTDHLVAELVRQRGHLQGPLGRLGSDKHAKPNGLPVVHLTTRRRVKRWLFPSPEQQSPDQKEEHGAGKGDDDLIEDRRANVDRDVQHAGQPTADDRAKDADDDVPKPAPAFAQDDTAGEEAGDQADHDRDDDVFECHCAI